MKQKTIAVIGGGSAARRHGWLNVDPRKPNEFLAEIVRWKDREIEQFRSYRQAEIQNLAGDRFEIIRACASVGVL
jgi:hypothetical protein